MESKKLTLREHCDECPEVEITDQGVTIGEDANTVRLLHAEWNELVRLIKSGELHEIWRNQERLQSPLPRGRYGRP